MIDELSCRGIAHHSADRKRLPTRASTSVFASPADAALILAEWAVRQVYWRSLWLRDWIGRRSARRQPDAQVAQRHQFVDFLRTIGVGEGALVMAHTSVSGLAFQQADNPQAASKTSIEVARELVSILIEMVGSSGTLCMPTHPVYKTGSRESASTTADSIPIFNPRSTPCGVGLANELFWRSPGTQRSLHPHNTLAARGPMATELLRDNLNKSKPLAHGIDSGYYRFCQRNGLLLSVGVPLTSCITIIHVREELLDENWPVHDFFEERDYLLRNGGEDRRVTIRKTRTNFMKFSLCNRKLRRDLVKAGIVHEGRVGTIRVDWARAGDVYQFLFERSRSSTYPFFFTSLVPRKSARNA